MPRTAELLLGAMLSAAACDASTEPPLPEDVYEQGWDETTPKQRVQVLRRDLRASLDAAARTQDASERATALEKSEGLLSALRAELVTSTNGAAEYEALEQELEDLEGGAQ